MNITVDAIQEEIRLRNVAQNRVIDVDTEFSRETVQKWAYYLEWIIECDKEEGISPEEALPITFNISSEGGEVLSCLYLCSLIEKYQAEGFTINTRVNAFAFSAGSMLLIHGSNRSAYKSSSIMFHQPIQGLYGHYTFKDQRDMYNEMRKLWKKMKGIICDKTLITDSKLEQIMNGSTDWFMDADEALKHGVIDEII